MPKKVHEAKTIQTFATWERRGYSIRGTSIDGVYIASRRNQHAVLYFNFFDELQHANDGEFYTSEAHALEAAEELALATV